MTGPDTETLTAALRRLADEHASGLLSVATPDRDVVLELADGVPVGIGPPGDVSGRVGRDASTELVAAAVIDDLVDRTVAAIVGGGGEWLWDVADDAGMMPVPPDLATELSRRAVDAAQALATLTIDQVLLPARDLETHGEVDRVRQLFDGDRTVAEVAELAGLTLPAVATLAAALVAAGVLATGQEDPSPRSWTDAVAGSSIEDDDEDEPELWVMDPPEDEDDWEDEEPAAPAATARTHAPQRAAHAPETIEAETYESREDAPASVTWRTDADGASEPVPTEPPAHAEPAAAAGEGAAVTRTSADEAADDWADTTWLDELGVADQRAAADRGNDRDEPSGDPRAALSAMITDLQDPTGSGPPATPAPTERQPPPRDAAPTGDGEDSRSTGEEEPAERNDSPDSRRKGPRAAPGEVAEFLRELSRLALDDE